MYYYKETTRIPRSWFDDVNRRLDSLEGNQAKPESGTTACSDAGGVVEQVKTAGSAGREPGVIEELVKWLDEHIVDLRGPNDPVSSRELGRREAYSSVLTKLAMLTEARR